MRSPIPMILLSLIFVVGIFAACSGGPEKHPLSAPTPSSAQARGQALFNGSVTKYSSCHSLELGMRIVGPSLADVATRAESRVPEKPTGALLISRFSS